MSDSRRRHPRASGLSALGEGIAIAWDAIAANKIRSILTMLGVAVGVSVVVAIAALITGLRSEVMGSIESAGPNNFVVTRIDFTAVQIAGDGTGRPPWWNRPAIEPEEMQRIAQIPSVQEALYAFDFQVDLGFENQEVENVFGRGFSSGWPVYQPGEFIAGRDFTPAEVQQTRAVVVITASLSLIHI